MDVYINPFIFLNQPQAFFNMAQSPLTKYIEFIQSYILRYEHIHPGRGKIFWWHE